MSAILGLPLTSLALTATKCPRFDVTHLISPSWKCEGFRFWIQLANGGLSDYLQQSLIATARIEPSFFQQRTDNL
jgi:hypothetical protein